MRLAMKFLPYLATAAIVAVLVWMLKPAPDPVYTEVEVPVHVIEQVEVVDTVVKWQERIVYIEVEPEQVAVADSGAVSDVEAFCAQAVEAERERARAIASAEEMEGAELARPDPMLLLRSFRHEKGWWLQKDKIIATGPRSDGSLWQGTFDVRDGFQGHVRGPEMLVQSPRGGLIRDLIEIAVPAALGYGACRIL